MKKIILVVLIVLLVLLCFSACGCEHEWQEATCYAPRTCSVCGKTKGGTSDHNLYEANCTHPKSCANCEYTEGNALGHNYVDNYCDRCFERDPNFVDLNAFGFTNMYGMNEWIAISEYSFSQKYVKAKRYNVNVFYGGYVEHIQIKNMENIYTEDLDVNDLSYINPVKKYQCSYANNDTLYTNSSFFGDLYIYERNVDDDNKWVVVKTFDEDSKDKWFVPCDILDFSTATRIDQYTYQISFK